jgi:hypothetical protein
MVRRARLTLASVLVAAAASGCLEGTDPGAGFLVRGRVQNNTGAPLPASARLVVVWAVSAGSPDYGYVWGEGVIDRMTGTLHVRFDGPPPAEALNHGVLGVGFVVATTDQSMKDGDVFGTGHPLTSVVGITAQHAVIFVGSHPDTLQLPAWVPDFDAGYSVGVGVKVPGVVFDRFAPVSPSSAILIIDALANIEVVNWT